jgi:hypothetical protein
MNLQKECSWSAAKVLLKGDGNPNYYFLNKVIKRLED